MDTKDPSFTIIPEGYITGMIISTGLLAGNLVCLYTDNNGWLWALVPFFTALTIFCIRGYANSLGKITLQDTGLILIRHLWNKPLKIPYHTLQSVDVFKYRRVLPYRKSVVYNTFLEIRTKAGGHYSIDQSTMPEFFAFVKLLKTYTENNK